MAYVNTYNASDFSAIIIDVLAYIGVAVVGFAGLAGLVLLYTWAKKRVGKMF